MEFKDRLRELRIEKKCSVRSLAESLEKSESAIRMWETGKAKPDADTLIKLSDFFEVSTDYMLGISGVKTLDTDMQALCSMTGLSEKAIANIQYMAKEDPFALVMFIKLVEDLDFCGNNVNDVHIAPYRHPVLHEILRYLFIEPDPTKGWLTVQYNGDIALYAKRDEAVRRGSVCVRSDKLIETHMLENILKKLVYLKYNINHKQKEGETDG